MNVRLRHDVDFSAVIFDGNRIHPIKYTAQINLVTLTTNSSQQNIAMQRILFFVHEIFDGSIFIKKDNPCLAKLKRISKENNIVEFPDEPYDQIIGLMLFHKLSAIAEDRFEIESIIIGGDNFGNMSYTIDDFTEFDVVYIPWWDRPDLSICENKSHPLYKMKWIDIDLQWDDDEIEIELEEAKPTAYILEGGPEQEETDGN